EWQKTYDRKNPWGRKLFSARSRCVDPNQVSYKNYGAKGIRCDLTMAQIRFLWERDGAWSMKIPSIDRRNSKGNYTLSNCRFIELSLNIGIGLKERYADRNLPNFCVKCGEKHYSKGLCRSHYNRQHRILFRGFCNTKDCKGNIHALGLCNKHYLSKRKLLNKEG
ncbi:hypothetical protein LCGC14_3071110, partial [marine sediment metagenome]